MSQRLYDVIHRIMQGPHRSGTGVVSEIIRPGEVRFAGRPERVLIAGNALPRLGQSIPWLSAGKDLLIASYNLRRHSSHLLEGTLTKRTWEQVLVGAAAGPFDAQLVHRDSAGRYWLQNHGLYYRQEAEHFKDSPWTLAGGTALFYSSNRQTWSLDPDELLELCFDSGYLVESRHVHIERESGALSFDTPASSIIGGGDWHGRPVEVSFLRDAAGRFHLATWCPSAYLDDGVWELYAMSDAPDAGSGWSWISETHWPENGVDLQCYPTLVLVGETPVCFRVGYRYIDDVYYGSISYRIFAGDWGARQETGFQPTAGATGDFAACGVPPNEVHIACTDVEYGLAWRKGILQGGSIAWEAPVPLLEGALGAATLYRNFRDGSPPLAAWAIEPSYGEGNFRHIGLPTDEWEGDRLDAPEFLPAWNEWDRPALAAGGGRAHQVESDPPQDDPLDGFLGWVTHIHGSGQLYAARIVEEDA